MQTTRPRPALPTLAALTLAAAPLLLAHPARAQTLTLGSGDSVTVNASGTHGTINNGTKSYNNAAYAGITAQTNGSSTFTLGAGGSLNSTGQYGIALDTEGTSRVTITGGALTASGSQSTALIAEGSSVVSITGGTFTAPTGGTGLVAYGGATIDLFGTGFTYTSDYGRGPITSGALATSPSGNPGTLSGTLLDGEAFSTRFDNYATIEVNVGTPPPAAAAVPEPSSVAAFLFTALGAAALTLRARKRLPVL